MAGVKLLEEARAAGLKVRVEGDRLIVRGPKSAERVAKALLEKKAEVLALLNRQPQYSPWPCEHCGQPAEIEAVEPRKDDGVLFTLWHCEPCQTWGVTPDASLRLTVLEP